VAVREGSFGGNPFQPAIGVVVVDEAAELLLLSADENPALLLRFAPRGVVEWFTGLQVAAHDRELTRCKGSVRLAAHAQGGAVGPQQDLGDVGDQQVRLLAHRRPSCRSRPSACRLRSWVVAWVMPGTSYPVVTHGRTGRCGQQRREGGARGIGGAFERGMNKRRAAYGIHEGSSVGVRCGQVIG
jgi:hypothetical protein